MRLRERLKTPLTNETESDRDGPPASVRFLRGMTEGARRSPERPEPEKRYVSRTTSSAAGWGRSTRTSTPRSSDARGGARHRRNGGHDGEKREPEAAASLSPVPPRVRFSFCSAIFFRCSSRSARSIAASSCSAFSRLIFAFDSKSRSCCSLPLLLVLASALPAATASVSGPPLRLLLLVAFCRRSCSAVCCFCCCLLLLGLPARKARSCTTRRRHRGRGAARRGKPRRPPS